MKHAVDNFYSHLRYKMSKKPFFKEFPGHSRIFSVFVQQSEQRIVKILETSCFFFDFPITRGFNLCTPEAFTQPINVSRCLEIFNPGAVFSANETFCQAISANTIMSRQHYKSGAALGHAVE